MSSATLKVNGRVKRIQFTGSLKKDPILQEKSVTPGTTSQTVSPDEGYDGLSAVVVAGDEELLPENIKSGVELFGVTGTCKTDPTLQFKSVTPGAASQTVAPDSGYDGLSEVIIAGDSDLIPENIKSGIELFGVTGTLEEGSGSGDGTSIPSAEGVSF